MKILSCNSNLPLADSISKELNLKLVNAEVKRFSDMEVFVEVKENVRGEDMFVIQSTSYPANDNLMELLVTLDALRRASAKRITAVIPYFGYARQDRKSGPRTPISAKLVANLITSAGADRVLTMPDATDTLVGKATTDTFTNKTVDLGSNTLTGSLAEFNSALQSATFVSLTGTETLENKTLTSPTINGGTFSGSFTGQQNLSGVVMSGSSPLVFEGATDDAYETTLAFVDPTADRTITFFNATDTLVGKATTDTLTNKSFDLAQNTFTGSLAEFNTALQSDSFVSLTGTEILTNKTLTAPTITSGVLNTGVSGSAVLDEDNMSSNSATKLATQQSIKAYVDATVSGQDLDISGDTGTIAIDLDSTTLSIVGGTGIATTGSGNTITIAVDNTVATLTGTQTLENKTLTSPVLNSPTITALTATALNLTDSSIVFEGATADAFETTLTVVDPTADRTITIPNETGTLITSASAATNAFSIALAAALG